jgi:hypothetical protein
MSARENTGDWFLLKLEFDFVERVVLPETVSALSALM